MALYPFASSLAAARDCRQLGGKYRNVSPVFKIVPQAHRTVLLPALNAPTNTIDSSKLESIPSVELSPRAIIRASEPLSV